MILGLSNTKLDELNISTAGVQALTLEVVHTHKWASRQLTKCHLYPFRFVSRLRSHWGDISGFCIVLGMPRKILVALVSFILFRVLPLVSDILGQMFPHLFSVVLNRLPCTPILNISCGRERQGVWPPSNYCLWEPERKRSQHPHTCCYDMHQLLVWGG